VESVKLGGVVGIIKKVIFKRGDPSPTRREGSMQMLEGLFRTGCVNEKGSSFH